jgi:anti-sigma B factor antagonist
MPDDYAPKPFRCEALRHDGEVRLLPQGDLDISTAPVLEEHIRQVLQDGTRQIIIDLRGLEFMDSTGLTLITRYSNESRRDGFNLALIEGSPRVQRLFDLTGLGEYFTFIAG